MLIGIMVLLEEGPSPPPPPRRYGGFGPGGGGGGGEWYRDLKRLLETPAIRTPEKPLLPPPEPRRRKRPPPPELGARDLAKVMRAMSGFTVAKTVTSVAERHLGKHGGGIAAILSIVATAAATRKLSDAYPLGEKIEGPMVVGSVIAAVDDLVDIYVNERGVQPIVVYLDNVHDFMLRARDHASIHVTSRTGTRKSTRSRVMVLRYTTSQQTPPTLYVYIEVVPRNRDGTYSIGGTLLETIRKVQKP